MGLLDQSLKAANGIGKKSPNAVVEGLDMLNRQADLIHAENLNRSQHGWVTNMLEKSGASPELVDRVNQEGSMGSDQWGQSKLNSYFGEDSRLENPMIAL